MNCSNREIFVGGYMDRKMDGHRERLRKKYIQGGYTAFHNYEILELLLTYAIPRKDTKLIAKELLEKFGNLETILNTNLKELTRVSGIGESAGAFLQLIGDVAKNLYKSEVEKEIVQLRDKDNLLKYIRSDIGFFSREAFKVIFLNNSNRIVGDEILFVGTIDKSAIYPREILEKALNYKAKGVIFAHNHPSGNIRPSKQDIQLTEHMQEVLSLVDIKLLEHIIITSDGYFSFLEEGLI